MVRRMKSHVVCLAAGAGLVLGTMAAPAHAGSNEVSTPIGSLSVTIDGGVFTEECTDFPYEVVVTGASSEVQWSAEIEATGSRGAESSAMSTDFGSVTVEDTIMICSSGGTGHGTWTAAVSVQLRNTVDTTQVYNRSMELTFTVSKATSVSTITSVSLGSSKTKVKGTVRDASGGSQTTMFGYVTIQAKKAGGSWRNKARVQVDEAGRFTATIDQAYAEGTKFKAVFAGTDEAKSSTSATWRS